jgi:hypothetical protein
MTRYGDNASVPRGGWLSPLTTLARLEMKLMPKHSVQVRTNDDLRELLAQQESAAWVVADDRERQLTHVQIVNFGGTQMIEGIFDREASSRREDGRLVLRFLDGRIINCDVQFDGQNPVRYLDG